MLDHKIFQKSIITEEITSKRTISVDKTILIIKKDKKHRLKEMKEIKIFISKFNLLENLK